MTDREEGWFWDHIAYNQKGCWLWLGSLTNSGYAQGPSGQLTHRWAYKKLRGDILKGKVLDHVVCNKSKCVNPWHVEICTPENARKTHCINGHEFTPINTWMRHQKGRQYPVRVCRECGRIRWRKWNAVRDASK